MSFRWFLMAYLSVEETLVIALVLLGKPCSDSLILHFHNFSTDHTNAYPQSGHGSRDFHAGLICSLEQVLSIEKKNEISVDLGS